MKHKRAHSLFNKIYTEKDKKLSEIINPWKNLMFSSLNLRKWCNPRKKLLPVLN